MHAMFGLHNSVSLLNVLFIGLFRLDHAYSQLTEKLGSFQSLQVVLPIHSYLQSCFPNLLILSISRIPLHIVSKNANSFVTRSVNFMASMYYEKKQFLRIISKFLIYKKSISWKRKLFAIFNIDMHLKHTKRTRTHTQQRNG